ncbi:MAG: hypothetical protein EKK41_05355 [Hyphomicrobiales bacterium]|nr:MAG: hypothetical protein EKK41_05355 [Hyphomicrobiales bacterium]
MFDDFLPMQGRKIAISQNIQKVQGDALRAPPGECERFERWCIVVVMHCRPQQLSQAGAHNTWSLALLK